MKMMISRKKQARRGLGLVEVMIAMVLLAVAILGAMGFRYYSATDARKADMYNNAARFSSLLLESWKGIGGLERFDAVETFGQEFEITESETGPPVPSGFTGLARYRIDFDRLNYYVTLSYKDATATEPRTLNVDASWLLNHQSMYDPSVDGSIELPELRETGDFTQSVKLTGYVAYENSD
jgi:prepilin-type N-terminal cleavage/methylation domain-containing protein